MMDVGIIWTKTVQDDSNTACRVDVPWIPCTPITQ